MASAFERDWIKRLAKQIAEALALMFKLKDRGEYAQALGALHGSYPSLFGLEPGPLRFMSPEEVGDLLGDTAKLVTLARLLEEEADLHEQLSDPLRAQTERQRAIALYLEAASRGGLDSESAARLKGLSARVTEPPPSAG